MVLAGHFERGGERQRGPPASTCAPPSKPSTPSICRPPAARVAPRPRLRASAGGSVRPARHALRGVRAAGSAGLRGRRCPPPRSCSARRRAARSRGRRRWARISQGTVIAGRIPELLTAGRAAPGRPPDPETRSGGSRSPTRSRSSSSTSLGILAEATALEARFFALVRGRRAAATSLGRFWWNLILAIRSAYAHDDPWTALQHSDDEPGDLRRDRRRADPPAHAPVPRPQPGVPRGVRAGRSARLEVAVAGRRGPRPRRARSGASAWPGCARTCGAFDEARDAAVPADRVRPRAADRRSRRAAAAGRSPRCSAAGATSPRPTASS